MNIQTLKRKAQYAAALAATTVMATPVMADDILSTASSEIGALKTAIVSFGGVVVGIAIAMVTISIVKRAINKA